MLQEEIARLTGTLKFNVEARPLVAFEKRLGGVLSMLRELSTLANKKFTVKVALDSRSLRSQIEKATNTKISLKNVDVSEEALRMQGKRIQDYLDKTTINLKNVKFDVAALIGQKRFVKTLMGQMSMELPIKVGMAKFESELRRDLKAVSERNPLKIKVDLNNNNLAMKLRRAMIEAQKRMGELKIRVAEPQVRLKVDKQHLVEEIRQAIAGQEFRIRVGARRGDGGGGGGYGSRGEGRGRSQSDRGLSAAMGFARGAIPGLGAAFAVSKINDINQKVTAATNSLEAVSGSEANFKSNKNYLDNMTKEMGLNFRDVAPQFSSIYQAASPAIGVKGTQDMFRGIMQYGTVHGLDKEAMKGSMVALSQMFGKDKIQSEEARQQFAERMPNGMALLAQASKNAGLTKNGTVKEFGDLMQKGNADPKKILPELGKLMKDLSEKNDAYKKSLETTRVAQGRMNHEFETAVTIFANSGFDKGMSTFFNTTAEAMARAKPLLEGLGKAFEILMTPVTAFIHLLGILGENWGKFADQLGVSKQALAVFASAVGLFMLPFGEVALAVGGLIVVLDDLATYFNGGDSIFGNMVKDTPGAIDEIDKITFAWDGLKAAIDDIGYALEPVMKDLNFKDVTMNDIFLQALIKVREQLEMIEGLMQRIAALMRGDWKAAVENLPGPKEILIDKNPMFAPARFWMPKIKDGFNSAVDGAGGWLDAHRQNAKMPTQQSNAGTQGPVGMIPMDTKPPTINLGGLTLQVQAPPGSDAKEMAQQMAPHVQELTKQALRDAFGAARAQQAERQ
ncbi:tape measure protein [Pseudomonas phage COT4]|uniref:Tape measure protein n=1 Tax=Pseudomonas phage M5.1 TaxID=2873460 RepID=A0AAE8XEQ0_9CAUD|nr:tape measure protein [Pseudomonas phage M5.1]UAV89673.1 tape measure protein [Pseudomonas phage M5.1]UGL61273.1 tape measure protein [Pseudomonas phage COT4]